MQFPGPLEHLHFYITCNQFIHITDTGYSILAFLDFSRVFPEAYSEAEFKSTGYEVPCFRLLIGNPLEVFFCELEDVYNNLCRYEVK
jgi:hypothetical protein